MADSFYPLRVFYEKSGRMRYISHLDMNRCISRILKRSGLPVWYTQGFHPHIYVTFALPLSLGFSGLRESFDFRLLRPVPHEEIKKRLGALLPPGLAVREVAVPVRKADDAAFARYRLTLPCETSRDARERLKTFQVFCEQSEILAEKHTKKGNKTVDIRPHFTLLSAEAEEAQLTVTLQTSASPTINLNPQLILTAFDAQTPPYLWSVCREDILDAQGNPFR